VDPNTQSQAIFIKIQNHRNPNLLSGEYLTAEFPGHPIDDAMEVPRNIVFNTNEVFVIVEDKLEKRVANIIKENEKTLVFNGLEEGEVLVMQPLINVLEGTLVEMLGDTPGQPETAKQGGETARAETGEGDASIPGRATGKQKKTKPGQPE